jgi:mannosyltransferase
MDKIFLWCKNNAAAIIILAGAFFVRILATVNIGDFSWDEVFSFAFSQKPWGQSWVYWTWETNPPLHMILQKLWFYVFPANEFFARLPAVLCSTATVAAIYAFGKKFFTKNTGLIAAALLAFHPYHIFLAAFARGYSMLLLLAIISIYFFLKIYASKEAGKYDFFILATINLLLAYTHLTAFLVLICETVILLVLSRKEIASWLKLHIIPALLWLIWAIPALIAKATGGDLGSAWFFNFQGGFWKIFIPLKLFLFGPVGTAFALALLILLTLGISYIIYRDRKTKNIETTFLLMLIFCLIPIIAATVLSLYNIRFLIIALPAFILCVGYVIGRLTQNTPLIAALVIIALCAPGVSRLFSGMPYQDWNKVNRYLAEHYNPHKKQLFICNDFIESLLIDKYYTAQQPKKIYFVTDGGNNWEKALILQNYKHYLHSENEMNSWYDKNRISGYDEIFMLYNVSFGVDLPGVLIKDNWRFVSMSSSSPTKDNRVMMYYAKP